MSFNSLEYLWFLPLVFCLYWFVFKPLRWQNLLVVVASYVFYGWWDWRFLVLIAFTTLCSYGSGLLIERYRREGQKRRAYWVCAANVTVNLLVLGVFKYLDFFMQSAVDAAALVGWHLDAPTLHILLPVGISFYTFQALGYSIDVNRGMTKASHDVVAFMAYVSFFPQLVAGPIERASSLMPQFNRPRTFDYAQAVDGLRQILWGYVKKLVIADNCATYVEAIYADPTNLGTQHLCMGLLLFFLQVYGDFSGYSDMAIGSAKLFGIRLRRNFDVPMFSRDISEYWRRWHQSLNSWFFDYVFLSLGGWNSKWKRARNVLVVFGLCGLWHGANWTYVCWGLYFGLLTMPYLVNLRPSSTKVVAYNTALPSLTETWQMTRTFALVLLGSPLFRCASLTEAWTYYRCLFTNGIIHGGPKYGHGMLVVIVLLFVVEWVQRRKEHPLQLDAISQRWIRYAIYYGLLILIFFYYISTSQFLYFQF